MRNKITTIVGYTANIDDAPHEPDARMAWIDAHIKSTYRVGHWNEDACKKIADKMGIVSKLSISYH